MYDDIPVYIKDYLSYMQNIRNRSRATIREYYYSLRDAFKFLSVYKLSKVRTQDITQELLDETDISDLKIKFFKSITLADLYEYLNFLSNIRKDKSTTRAGKVAALKSFFNYLTFKQKILDKNPTVELETPKISKRLPKYLTLEESVALLHSVDGKFKKRDLCILTLFLNCGLRLSELVSINIKDIKGDILTVVGKGDKERSIYLNRVCQEAIEDYIASRPKDIKDREALFISERGTRIR